MYHNTVEDIRESFAALFLSKQFISLNREASMTDLVGNSVIEITGASFIADEDAIFGEVNHAYIDRELEWYMSMSLNVNDIPGGAPKIWAAVADRDGFICSNYGWCILSDGPDGNGDQYENVWRELKANPHSRRAVMIYTRPSMWKDYNHNGRSDFMCTTDVQYLIRNGKLEVVVRMRSGDSYYGYRNDFAWQKEVQRMLIHDLNQSGIEVSAGKIVWQVGSLHLYSKDYYLVDHYVKTGEISITKKRYKELYPDSKFI